MKALLSLLSPSSGRRYHSSSTKSNPGESYIDPFRRFPNVSKFKVEVNSYDALMLKHGLVKRLEPTITSEPHTNARRNRYVDHIVRRLNKHKGNPVLYFCISKYILQRSDTFMLLSLITVKPNWHRELSRFKVMYTIKKVKAIRRSLSTLLQFKRVFIPKADGTKRGLGVPTLEWRIYLNTYNSLLTIYLYDFMPLNQHGFLPGRSTLTAWQDFFANAKDAPDIYEFDLKKFFPSLTLSAVSNVLRYYKIPEWVVCNLEELNSNYAIIPEEASDWERQAISQLNLSSVPTWDPMTESETVENRRRVPLDYWSLYDSKGRLDLRQVYRSTLGRVKSMTIKEQVNSDYLTWSDYYKGLPQGSPLSPLLSITVLYTTLLHKAKHVMYADDGFFYGEGLEYGLIQSIKKGTPVMDFVNVHIHPDKSGFVKQNGQWLKPFKFLGLTYDPFTDTLKASTRNGASLVFDKEALITESRLVEKAKLSPKAYKAYGLASLWESIAEMAKSFKFLAQATTNLVKSLFYDFSQANRRSTYANYAKSIAILINLSKEDKLQEDIIQQEEGQKEWSPSEILGYGPSGGKSYKSYRDKFSWDHFIQSKLAGLIQNRLYQDNWNSDVSQDFTLSYIPSSWEALLLKSERGLEQGEHSVFNSSSFAIDTMFQYLRNQKIYRRRQEAGLQFTKTFGRIRS